LRIEEKAGLARILPGFARTLRNCERKEDYKQGKEKERRRRPYFCRSGPVNSATETRGKQL